MEDNEQFNAIAICAAAYLILDDDSDDDKEIKRLHGLLLGWKNAIATVRTENCFPS